MVGLFFLPFGEKKASWIPEESRRSMSTAGRTRRETRAQECAASAQTLPDVGAAASVSISNISPAVAGSVVSVFSRASPMCDFLQKKRSKYVLVEVSQNSTLNSPRFWATHCAFQSMCRNLW